MTSQTLHRKALQAFLASFRQWNDMANDWRRLAPVVNQPDTAEAEATICEQSARSAVLGAVQYCQRWGCGAQLPLELQRAYLDDSAWLTPIAGEGPNTLRMPVATQEKYRVACLPLPGDSR